MLRKKQELKRIKNNTKKIKGSKKLKHNNDLIKNV